jgi:hypothetical protein
MKILTLSDGTQIEFPEWTWEAPGSTLEQIAFVENYILNLEYPVGCLRVGDINVYEYSCPADLFSRIKTFDGIEVRPVQNPNSCWNL